MSEYEIRCPHDEGGGECRDCRAIADQWVARGNAQEVKHLRSLVDSYKQVGPTDLEVSYSLGCAESVILCNGECGGPLILARALRAAFKKLDDITKERDELRARLEAKK